MGITINLAKPKTQPKRFKLFMIVIALIAFIGGIGFLAMPSQKEKDVFSRAEKVFQYDRQNPHKLANHDVMTLSMMLGFKNIDSAEKVLKKLEREI